MGDGKKFSSILRKVKNEFTEFLIWARREKWDVRKAKSCMNFYENWEHSKSAKRRILIFKRNIENILNWAFRVAGKSVKFKNFLLKLFVLLEKTKFLACFFLFTLCWSSTRHFSLLVEIKIFCRLHGFGFSSMVYVYLIRCLMKNWISL